MSKSVLIIGGTGFFGSALQDTMRRSGNFEVTAAGSKELDLLKRDDAQKARDYDIVINASGQMTEPTEKGIALNTEGIRNLLSALQGSNTSLVQMSSTTVYGAIDCATEDAELHPQSPYAIAKAGAERMIRDALASDRYLIVRLCNLYGPHQQKGMMQFVIRSALSKKGMTVTDNDGTLRRHFIHIEDAAEALRDLIEAHATGTVNIASGEAYSLRDLVGLCEEILDREIPASYGKTAPNDTITHIDTAKLRKLISPSFAHSVPEFLREQLLYAA